MAHLTLLSICFQTSQTPELLLFGPCTEVSYLFKLSVTVADLCTRSTLRYYLSIVSSMNSRIRVDHFQGKWRDRWALYGLVH